MLSVQLGGYAIVSKAEINDIDRQTDSRFRTAKTCRWACHLNWNRDLPHFHSSQNSFCLRCPQADKG